MVGHLNPYIDIELKPHASDSDKKCPETVLVYNLGSIFHFGRFGCCC